METTTSVKVLWVDLLTTFVSDASLPFWDCEKCDINATSHLLEHLRSLIHSSVDRLIGAGNHVTSACCSYFNRLRFSDVCVVILIYLGYINVSLYRL